MERREFLVGAAATAAGVVSARSASAATESRGRGRKQTFKCAYAPHFGMFQNSAGGDLVAQLEFAADQGFTAWEDNGMMGRTVEEQEKLASAMDRLGIRMGIFVCNMATAWDYSFCRRDKALREKFLDEIKQSIDVAKRMNTTLMTCVLGRMDERLHPEFQLGNAIEQLRMAADILEPHGLTMVIEPLNPYRDHPGMLLARATQAYAICKGVNSPACKILFDIYHMQIAEGNLIPNIDNAWDEIAYFQIGDNPGRNEPLTGEINYRSIFKHVHERGYTGILGMEHGNSQGGKDGEQKVIDAYRWCDDF